MPELGGLTFVGSQPTNGVAVSAYVRSRFVGALIWPPPYDSAKPAGAPDAGPVNSGRAFGGDGAWQLAVPTADDYAIAQDYGGHIAWTLATSPAEGASSGPGTLAARPAANTVIAGFIYVATDVAGGSAYISNGAAWLPVAPGVSAASGREVSPPVESLTDTHRVVAAAAGTAIPAGLAGAAAPTFAVPLNSLQPTELDIWIATIKPNTIGAMCAVKVVDETGATAPNQPGIPVRSGAPYAVGIYVGPVRFPYRIPAGTAAHTYHLEAWVPGGGGAVSIDLVGLRIAATLR